MNRVIAPVIIGLLGAAILVWLGTWQIQRLAWKQGVLAEIETTIAGDAQPLPQLISPEDQRYLPVSLAGTAETDGLYVLDSVKRQGPGWRVITAFQTEDGRRVLIDRGFTPTDQKATVLAGGDGDVTGNLLWPDDRNASTPENDTTKNIWFARDVALMAEALQTEPLLVIVRSMTPADTHVTPLPVDTSGIPNDHKQYAITWFSLAVVWLIMTALWIRRRLTEKDE